jgi:drug/metabolite transporter (DMT)-like permease
VRSARGAAYGLAAAALFGASAPLTKLLLPQSSPLMLAALLYLGAGLALSLYRAARPRRAAAQEAPLSSKDIPALVGIAFFGGVLGPVLLLSGLARVSGFAGSLLLNLETPFTMTLAVMFFHEHLGRNEFLGAVLIVVGAAVLSARPGESLSADGLGIAFVAGACLSWALDNNLSQRVSGKDPVAIVQGKALSAGAVMLLIAVATGHLVPSAGFAAIALGLGSVSYGLSMVLHLRALRLLGAARQAAFFATAPFIGAALAIPILGERPTAFAAFAGILMVSGALLLVRARHSHLHDHAPLEHEHLHVHDEHHQHPHEGPVTEPHTHPHRHVSLTHRHPHVSDVHHRHPHD